MEKIKKDLEPGTHTREDSSLGIRKVTELHSMNNEEKGA